MRIYAHRGASRDFPELTEAAYRGAADQGADGFECDLRLTRDLIPILWHNPSMHEQTGHPGLIAEMRYSEIKAASPSLLTLDEFFDISLELNKSVLLETKHPVITGNKIEEILAEKIKDRKILRDIDCSVISFSWGAIEKIHRIEPAIPTTLLLSQVKPFAFARFSSADAIAPDIKRLRENPSLAAKIKSLGKDLYTWTVDDEVDVKLASELGVDILITNTPARARGFL